MRDEDLIKDLAHSLKMCMGYIDDLEEELNSHGLLDDFCPLTSPFGVAEYIEATKALKRAMDGSQDK